MKILKKMFQKNGYVIFSLSVLVASLVFALSMVLLFGQNQRADQTTVGHIYLGDKNPEDYPLSLTIGVDAWKNQAQYKIVFQEYEMFININWFDFDLERTVDEMVPNQRNEAYFNLSSSNRILALSTLETYFSKPIIDFVLFDDLLEDIHQDLENLSILKVYNLYQYLDEPLKSSTISSTVLTNITPADVDQIWETVQTITIQPGWFSLLKKEELNTLNNTQLSILASGIQQLIFPTSFSGITRQQYLDLPSWAALGKNVRILRVSEVDFTFFNNQTFSYTVVLEKVNANTLSFELQGVPFITTYIVTSTTDDKIDYQTLYIEDDSIDQDTPGVEIIDDPEDTIYRIVEQSGQNGSITVFTRSIQPKDGEEILVNILQEIALPISQIYRQNSVPKGGS